MKIVIVGAGAVGYQIAERLISDDKDVVLIEKDPETAKNAANHLDCIVLNGEGNSVEVLKNAGIHDADVFISVTNSDEVNMISCSLVASEFNIPYKIARVRNIDYSSSRILNNPFFGIDFVVNPEIEAAKEIVKLVEYGASSDVMLFHETNFQMRNIIIDAKSIFKDRIIAKIRQSAKEDFLVACILRQDEVIIPQGNSVLYENDNVYIVATQRDFENFFDNMGKSKKRMKNVVVVGGGRVGRFVTRYLIYLRKNIKLIDSDYENCELLADEFPEAIIINSDISDEDIFKEERLLTHDLIITTTGNQELNILTAIYAKTIGIKRAIALVNKNNYLTIAANLGIDAIVSPKSSAVDTILERIMRGNIRSIHNILGGKAEVIEFTLDNCSSIIGKSVRELRMPDDSLILAVTRNGKSIIPDGNSVIQENDNIIVISKKESLGYVESFVCGRI